MGSSSEAQTRADQDFSTGHYSLEGTSPKAYLVSSCDKTLRWRCFAFKSLAWSSGSQLWLHIRITWAALETWGAQTPPRPLNLNLCQGPEPSQHYFAKTYQMVLGIKSELL